MEGFFHVLFAAGVAAVAFGAGVTCGLHYNYSARLARLGLTRQSAGLYRQAIKLLTAVHQSGDLDDFTFTHPVTARHIAQWVAEADGAGVANQPQR